ncbi:hypothetical protein BCR32DRAFT_293848 [Anaeromyces robustus]|uniref:BHLH domain-containing protein n=1 Tax=Anaeromyces robustus TaxID=1754192 RepID=A0A1Y1X477_9FUNG|nr:hypothetical protein BCR32DRAFT_293848 [Anaeromyces robustus]|eukprot:ORX80455.1 hypothetical protein BCR32DRAFT_293848 [Anaeromyces robustus]
MDMLYFDDMPIDWQLSMLNNSQNGEENVDISLLNQISNDIQNAKGILNIKLSDNHLNHFLNTMDQSSVNHYHQNQINTINTTAENINSMATTTATITPIVPQHQFINTNNINNPHMMQNMNTIQNINNTISLENEVNIPVTFPTTSEPFKSVDMRELINGKMNIIPNNNNNNVHNTNYPIIYNQGNNIDITGTTINKKRKETMPDINTININNNNTKKMKKISENHTQNYTLPSTVVNTTNIQPNGLNSNVVMNLPLNNYGSTNQDQYVIQYINDKDHNNVTTEGMPINQIPHIINTIITNTPQNMDTVMVTTPNTVTTIPSTMVTTPSSTSNEITSCFIPNMHAPVKVETGSEPYNYIQLIQPNQSKGINESDKENHNILNNNNNNTNTNTNTNNTNNINNNNNNKNFVDQNSNFISPNLVNSLNNIITTNEQHQQTQPQFQMQSQLQPVTTHTHIQQLQQQQQQQQQQPITVTETSVLPIGATETIQTNTSPKENIISDNKTNNKIIERDSAMKKVKIEGVATDVSNENLLNNTSGNFSSASTSTTNPISSSKYPLNMNNPSSSSSNPKLNSVSWVKTQEKSEMKMAISRLKTNEPIAPVIPLQVIKHQKKVAHNAIERKYRNNINDRIKQLQDVIPALQYTKNIKEREKKNGGDEDVVKIDESLIIDGIPAARKLNKATVLKSATDYIVHLKKTSTDLKEENKRLYEFIKKIGGDEMLTQFTQENNDLYDDKLTNPTNNEEEISTSTSTSTTNNKIKAKAKSKSKTKKVITASSSSSSLPEKAQKKEKDKQQPVQEASPPHIYSSDSPSPTQINSSDSSTSSNEDEGTMLDVLSGERENPQNNINNFNSDSTFTTLMVSLLLFSVGLFEYGSYLNSNSDSMSYENYVDGSQGKVLLARSENSSNPSTYEQSSFYQYMKSKFARMDENFFVAFAFYIFVFSIIVIIGKRITGICRESRNKCISSIEKYSIFDKILLFNKIFTEIIALVVSKISLRLFEKIYYLKKFSYTKLILSHCRMIEREILIAKNKSQQSLLAVFYTSLQIINNIHFVTNEISYSTCAYILYTTAIQFYMNFRNMPFGKMIAIRIWKKGNEYVSKKKEDKEEYDKNLKRSKKFDDYKRKRKINIENSAIDFILNYINDNTKKSEEFFAKGHWISFLDHHTIEMSNSLYDFSNQKCLLITFSTAYKYDGLLDTFKEYGLKYIYMAPSTVIKSGETAEIETDSELENSVTLSEQSMDNNQIKEEIKNDYLSLSSYYISSDYLFSTLEAPINKIVGKLITDREKKDKEQDKMMKIDKILEAIIKVANSSLIVNDINLYWYSQMLWIMVSWKKEYLKPVISESNMDKINVHLFYAEQFRKLIISSVTSYYSDVVNDNEDLNEEPRSTYSDDLYSYSSSELEEKVQEKLNNRKGKENNNNNNNEEDEEDEEEYISEFKTETIPETITTTETSLTTNNKLGIAHPSTYQSMNYSTFYFISDSTRQFITLSLFTWLMVQKKKYNIAKRSIEKAHEILEKITNISLDNDSLSFTSLFEEENDYYPDIMLKFERVVVILAGTWLVEAEKIILFNEKNENNHSTSEQDQTNSLQLPSKLINNKKGKEKDNKDEDEDEDENEDENKNNEENNNEVENQNEKILRKEDKEKEKENPIKTEGNTTKEKKDKEIIKVTNKINKKEEEEEDKEKEINSANEVISLPKVSSNNSSIEFLSSNLNSKSLKAVEDLVVPRISLYVERYIKLLHYYQEMLPFIGSDKIALECFKIIQHYQNDYKKYCFEFQS